MRNSFETVEEIEKSGKTMLLAEEVRNILGLNPNSIRRQAQEDPLKLGFPVIVTGARVSIPAVPFIMFMRGELCIATSTFNYTVNTDT